MKNLFKQLYENEINISFSWFWDEGYDVKIGDDINGFEAEFNSYDINEVEQWIILKVNELYPGITINKTL